MLFVRGKDIMPAQFLRTLGGMPTGLGVNKFFKSFKLVMAILIKLSLLLLSILSRVMARTNLTCRQMDGPT